MKHKITASPPHKSFRAQNFPNKESSGIKIFAAGPENEMRRLVLVGWYDEQKQNLAPRDQIY